MWGFRSLALAATCSGVRINLHDSDEMQSFAMMETISMANGFMNMTVGGRINKACETEIWDPALTPKFSDRRVVGSGATACVWLGKDETGTLVAIKVGKNSGGKAAGAALAAWKSECRSMQLLRFDACKAGKDILALHEQFIPTCTGVGATSTGGAYYIMHAAGTTGFKEAPEKDWSVAQRKQLFSSLVTSLYAMHIVDQTHNDLHGQNIVLDKNMNMALIDFGELKTPDKSWVMGYKRDGNAVWRWAEVLAGCPQASLWATSFDQGYLSPPVAAATKKCLQSNWGADSQFISQMDTIMNNGMDRKLPHGIMELYKTSFVQSNLPAPKANFVPAFADGCLNWDAAKMNDVMLQKQFEDHVQCDTIPSFFWTKTSTKRGKTRTRQIQQCGGLQGACAILAPSNGGKDNLWQCDGMSIARGSQCGDLIPCLTDKHPAYKFTKPYSR
jgi:serine/threonine protein kinase